MRVRSGAQSRLRNRCGPNRGADVPIAVARLRAARPVVAALLPAASVLLVLDIGCASRPVAATRPAQTEPAAARRSDTRVEEIRRDIPGYLREIERRCAALEQYKVLFTRLERRGMLFKSLQGPEQIECSFRRVPFSIRMRWLDDKIKYGESTYVAGVENNQVRFTPRHGLFGLPPGLTKVDLRTPVVWGEAQRPLDEWGLERLVQATQRSIRESEARGGAALDCRGIVTMQNTGRAAYHLHFEYRRPAGESSMQDLYVDVETELPCGSTQSFADGRVDSMYLYERLDADVHLTDADFVLDVERRGRAGGESAEGGQTTETRQGLAADAGAGGR